MKKILVTDKLAQEGIDVLEAVEGFQVDCKCGMASGDLKKEIKIYDALIIRSQTIVSAAIIEEAARLKCIGRAGVGLDNVDLEAARKKGIVVLNAPAGNTTATAEYTMGLILAVARHIPAAHLSLRQGKWERVKFRGIELSGKTLGIVGLGRIGSAVANRAKAFGMNIIGFDPNVDSKVFHEAAIQQVSFKTLLQVADFITFHLPKIEETINLITSKELSMMKRSAFLVNCSRGGVVNEEDLANALKAGKIAGAAVDVYDDEPPDFQHPLFKCDNCIVSPHLGAATVEAKSHSAVEIAELVRDVLLGEADHD